MPIDALALFPGSAAITFINKPISHFYTSSFDVIYELLTNFYEVQHFFTETAVFLRNCQKSAKIHAI
jgi:hypothetical protein